MIKVEHSVTINKPAADVFAYIVDPANTVKYDDELLESKLLTPGPIAVGSVITDKRKFIGREMDSELKVTAYEPNSRFALKVTKGPVPFEITYTLSAAGGGTQLNVKAEGEPGGFFKLAGGLVAKQLQASLEKTSAQIKKNLES